MSGGKSGTRHGGGGHAGTVAVVAVAAAEPSQSSPQVVPRVPAAPRACDVCLRPEAAAMYCAADDAYLCGPCDVEVHNANALSARHERVRLGADCTLLRSDRISKGAGTGTGAGARAGQGAAAKLLAAGIDRCVPPNPSLCRTDTSGAAMGRALEPGDQAESAPQRQAGCRAVPPSSQRSKEPARCGSIDLGLGADRLQGVRPGAVPSLPGRQRTKRSRSVSTRRPHAYNQQRDTHLFTGGSTRSSHVVVKVEEDRDCVVPCSSDAEGKCDEFDDLDGDADGGVAAMMIGVEHMDDMDVLWMLGMDSDGRDGAASGGGGAVGGACEDDKLAVELADAIVGDEPGVLVRGNSNESAMQSSITEENAAAAGGTSPTGGATTPPGDPVPALGATGGIPSSSACHGPAEGGRKLQGGGEEDGYCGSGSREPSDGNYLLVEKREGGWCATCQCSTASGGRDHSTCSEEARPPGVADNCRRPKGEGWSEEGAGVTRFQPSAGSSKARARLLALEHGAKGGLLQCPALKLNYEDVLKAWSCRGSSPWLEDCSEEQCPGGAVYFGLANPQPAVWELQLLEEPGVVPTRACDPAGGGGPDSGAGAAHEAGPAPENRKARVNRYREKRRLRLFSKTIRYEVRKINAERRPRIKGRFVKSVPT